MSAVPAGVDLTIDAKTGEWCKAENRDKVWVHSPTHTRSKSHTFRKNGRAFFSLCHSGDCDPTSQVLWQPCFCQIPLVESCVASEIVHERVLCTILGESMGWGERHGEHLCPKHNLQSGRIKFQPSRIHSPSLLASGLLLPRPLLLCITIHRQSIL